MLMGAVAGFVAALTSGSLVVGVAAAVLAGTGMSLLFAFMAVSLAANQYAAGLALTILVIASKSLIMS